MKYYRCKCGESETWSSMGVWRCKKCSKCGSNLALSPQDHDEVVPHRMLKSKIKSYTDDGEVEVGDLTRCVYCNKTKAEIIKLDDQMEDYDSVEALKRDERDLEIYKKLYWKNEK